MFNVFGVSEWSARFPSFLLGVLTIPIFYLTWKNVLGRNAAFLGALFIALSSWHIGHSQFARYYTGVFLFGSLSYFFYYQALRRGSVGYLVSAIISIIGGFLFHATAIMVPAALMLFSLIVLLSNGATSAGYSKKIAALYLVINGICGLAVIAPLWGLLTRWQASGRDYGYGPVLLTLQVIKYVQIPVAVSGLFGLIVLARKDLMKGLFFLVGIGVPAGALVAGSTSMDVRPDYVIYALPLIFALAAFLCEEARQCLTGYGVGSYALAAVVTVSMVPELVSHYSGRTSLDFREVVGFVDRSYRPGDRILVFQSAFRYYASKEYMLEPYPGRPYGDKVDWQNTLKKYEAGPQRVWFILPVRRKPLARDLEAWLFDNASLVWRKYEKRYDYTVRGYQIFLAESTVKPASDPINGNPRAAHTSYETHAGKTAACAEMC